MKIQRYKVTPFIGRDSGKAILRVVDREHGDWCKSTDVATLESELARLREVEKAATKLIAFVPERADFQCLDCCCLESLQDTDEWKALEAAAKAEGV